MVKLRLKSKSILILLLLCANSLFFLASSTKVSALEQPTLTWSRIRTSYQSLGFGVAVGSDSVYIVGNENGLALLAKYDFDGNQLWNTTWSKPGNYENRGFGVAVGSDGVYTVGMTGGYGQAWAFLVRYDFSGQQLWNQTWGLSMPTTNDGRGVAVGSDGVYVVGRIWPPGSSGYMTFLVKYGFSGNQLWNVSLGLNSVGNGVAVGNNGVYIVADIFLSKYDFDGNQIWNRTNMGGIGQSVAIDGDAVYFAGYTNTVYDALLVKYDSDGNQLWSRTWGGPDHDFGHGVAVGNAGIYIVGETEYKWFDQGWHSSYFPFLVKYDSNGNRLWNTTWPNPGYGAGVAVGSTYIVGYTYESFPEAGPYKAFLARYDLPPPPTLSDFDGLFATNDVRVIYPSDNASKPLGCLPALVSDWTASAFVTTKLGNYVEGLDTQSSYVNQTSGRPMGASGVGIVTFGGCFVNPVVKYAEIDSTPLSDRAQIRFFDGGDNYYFQHWDGSSILGASVPASTIHSTTAYNQDMFVIEVYKDGGGRYVMICYGFGWKGTYAAGKYFDKVIFPNLPSHSESWTIVRWDDTNGDGFVNNPSEGDTYTVIALG